MMALLVAVGRSYAFDLSGWLGLDGDSGSGNYADLAFHLRENFIPTSIVWSPDGRYIASTGTQTRTLHIWDVTTKQIIRSMELPGSPAGLFHNMAWSPDGRYLALCNSFSSSLVFTKRRLGQSRRILAGWKPAAVKNHYSATMAESSPSGPGTW